MFRYETHCHTYPVSKCCKASVRQTLQAYKELGYNGVFITNHFLDGNINIDHDTPYEEKLDFYFSDYDEAKLVGKELGLQIFLGVEISYKGTDFLIYGLTKEWWVCHPEVMELDIRSKLRYYMDHGALVIHAHPFREADYIDHLRLFPRDVHGVEILNACRRDLENRMADIYAKEYGFLITAGTDNHRAGDLKSFAGMEADTPLRDEADFVQRVREGSMHIFSITRE